MAIVDRLLVVGLGSIGRRHLRLANELLPEAKIAVLRRPNSPISSDPAIDHVFTDLREALSFRPQAAVIASPATHHLSVAIALAESGAHLLVEKPISVSSVGVGELTELCAARGLALMTGYNLRFLPSLRRLRDLVAEKRIGRVLSVRAEVGQYLPTWRPDSDYRQAVSARATLGGGVLLELSHEFDYLRWLFGEVEWVSCAQRKLSDLDIDVDDTAHVILGFAPDAAGRSLLASVTLDFIRHDATRGAVLIGETGTLRWNAAAGTVEIFERNADAWVLLAEEAAERDDPYRSEWRHFLDCIASGAAPEPSGSDGLAVLQIVEAARVSSSTRCVARVKHATSPSHRRPVE